MERYALPSSALDFASPWRNDAFFLKLAPMNIELMFLKPVDILTSLFNIGRFFLANLTNPELKIFVAHT